MSGFSRTRDNYGMDSHKNCPTEGHLTSISNIFYICLNVILKPSISRTLVEKVVLFFTYSLGIVSLKPVMFMIIIISTHNLLLGFDGTA